ncbi:MAG: hypothetical protein WC915_00365 [archaeon]|jgi:hypothetical protein
MDYKTLTIVLILITLLSVTNAYTGFNREYYTNNYQSNYYVPSPAYSTTYTVNGYINSTPNAYNYGYGTYPTYGYNTYSTYGYGSYSPYTYTTTYNSYPNYYSTGYYGGSYTTIVQPSYYPYGRTLSVWKNDSGWGLSYGSSSICTMYGYC